MKSLPYIYAILFTIMAAFGNAIYAWGVRKASPTPNPFLFASWAFLLSTAFSFLLVLYFEKSNVLGYFLENKWWILFAVGGFVMTQVSFVLLYQNFGASQYTMYAVFSILTTSLLVGVLILGERFNIYHLLALISAILTVVLFVLGNKQH